MKFSCLCGEVIYDNTDYQEDKAYFMPDQSYEIAMTELEKARNPWETMRKFERTMYQCRACSRLWLEDHDRTLHCFKPEPQLPFGILTRGEAP